MNKSIKIRISTLFVMIGFCISLLIGYNIAFAKGQPHMEKALRYLMMAKDELKIAKPNKKGHRIKAMEKIDEAIMHVKKGIKAAEKKKKKYIKIKY